MKLTKLIPIVSIAAVTSPMITLCSCATTINLDTHDTFCFSKAITLPVLRNHRAIDLKKGNKYRINVGMNKWALEENVNEYWIVFVVDIINYPDKACSKMSNYKVWIDGTELKQPMEGEELHSGQFTYGQINRSIIGLMGAGNDLKSNSKMKIEFNAPEDKQGMYVVFAFDSFI